MKSQYSFFLTIPLLAVSLVFLQPHDSLGGRLGSLSASVSLFSDSIVRDDEEDSSYLTLYSLLDYSSPLYSGFSFQLSAVDGTEIWEDNDDDAEEATGSLLNQFFIEYASDTLLFRLGRQELEQEWLTDFHEAASIEFQPSELLQFRTGWSRKFAIGDIDELFENFEDIGDNGVFFGDATLKSVSGEFEFSPYVLHTPDIFTGYGVKITLTPNEWLLLGSHWGGSNVEESGESDGSIFHLFATLKRGSWSGGGGVVVTGDGGAGLLDSFGDSIDPFEEANLVYEADALTYYLTAEYQNDSLDLIFVGGRIETDDQYENEFTLLVEYDLSDYLEGVFLLGRYTYFAVDDSQNDSSFFSLAIGWEINIE